MHLVSAIDDRLDNRGRRSEKCDVAIRAGRCGRERRCRGVTQKPHPVAPLVPSRFHVLHLHVKLD